jgi:hypothetical protein
VEASPLSRYRKVEVKTYSDEKFRQLSPIPPCGQGLWLYLITGPHTTSIPGLFRAGRAALAEELGWTQEAFDKAFEEVFRQGMAKADWGNRVVWIPNAIRHNEPASPNVVKSWAAEMDLIPECALKVEAIEAMAVVLGAMNPAFSEAFGVLQQTAKTSGKPSRKPSSKASPKTLANQEQEQEQEQEEQKTLALTALAVPASVPFIALPLNDGSEFSISEERICEWQTLYPAIDVRQEVRKYKGWAVANPIKRKTRRGILASVNVWLAKSHDDSGNNRNGGINHASNRGVQSIAAVERQRVTHDSIRAAGVSRYGIGVVDDHGAGTGSVSESVFAGRNPGDVSSALGATSVAARTRAVSGRVIEGHG